MTTEPLVPGVRELVYELLEAAPGPPPIPDPIVAMTEPGHRGHSGRRRALVALLSAIVVLSVLGAALLVRHATRREPPVLHSSTTIVTGAHSAADVVYVDRRGLVVRVSGEGREVVVAPGAVVAPRWSPSGQWLAYRVGNALSVVRRDGSRQRVLSDHAAPTYFEGAYAWSPSADALAVLDGPGVQVWWFSRTSAESVEIVPPVGGVEHGALSFAWSRDGTSLGISMERRLQAGPGRPEDSLWLATGVCTRAPTACSQPRRLRQLAFTPGVDDYPLFVAGFAFGDRDLLTWADYGGSGSILQDGVPLEAIPLDGGPAVTVATTLVRDSWVRPSPDGRRLLVVRSDGRMVTDNREVDICDSASSCRVLAPGDDVQTLDPSWSPDGTRVVFVREEHASSVPPIQSGAPRWETKYRSRRLWVANADGSGADMIAAAGGGLAEPQFSPDGTSIVFVRDARVWQLDEATNRLTASSGSMRLSDDCTFDDCLPDAAVYETIARWSDHVAVRFR